MINNLIVVKKSNIHKKGVFAKKLIAKNTEIIEYVGEKITKAEADRRGAKQLEKSKNHSKHGGVYLFTLNKRYDIDGNVPYNTAKWINHSCEPNCEPINMGGEIWIVALRDIQKGEELHYNYSYDIDGFIEHPCKCGSSRCVGYIVDEDQWQELEKLKLTMSM